MPYLPGGDPHMGEHLRTLEGHSSSVISVAFSPHGRLLESALHDNTIPPLEDQTTRHPHNFRPMTSFPCVYSIDGQGHTLIHDAHTGKLVKAQGKFSFLGDQDILILENHWVCV